MSNKLIGSDVAIGTWTLDPAATTVGIRHRTMWGMVAVKGSFAGVRGSGTVAADGSLTGEIVVDAATLDTGHTKRDEHVRSADLLDVATHPEIVVHITSGSEAGDELTLDATITVKGVTRSVPLHARITELSADSITATVTGELDRQELGLTWNKLAMLKDLTEVTVDAVFTRTSA